MIGREKIFTMKFVDDVVLIADEAEDLRSMLTRSEKYPDRNKLRVNINKKKIRQRIRQKFSRRGGGRAEQGQGKMENTEA